MIFSKNFPKKIHGKTLVLASFVFLIPANAMAGFEWNSAPQQASVAPRQDVSTSAPMQDQMMDFSGMETQTAPAAPRAPVISEPLAPVNLAPVPAPMMAKVRPQKSGGLYIDPYPLQSNNASGHIASVKMEQALAEKSGGLNPVQLGGGMTTGVSAKSNMVSTASRVNRGKSIASIGPQSLTPFLGDEPAPLPGYGVGAVERESMRQYAQAVGFGKDLPLALAISQLVPSDFTHRFDGDIDASVMVDWDGGKPWNVVLNDMLRAQNMTSEIKGNVVVIKKTAKI